MANLLTTISSIMTAIISWVQSVVNMIMASGNELLLLFVVLPVGLIAIGVVRRLIRL